MQGNTNVMNNVDIHVPNAGDNLSESLTVEVSGRFSADLSEDSEPGKGYSGRGRYVCCLLFSPSSHQRHGKSIEGGGKVKQSHRKAVTYFLDPLAPLQSNRQKIYYKQLKVSQQLI